MEICRWSRQNKADEFMDFVWEIMDRLIRGESILSQRNDSVFPDIYNELLSHRDWMSAAGRKIEKIESSIGYLNYYHRRQSAASRDTKWMLIAKRKFKALSQYLGVEDRKVLADIYIKMEDQYHIDLDLYQADYNFKYMTDRSSRLSVIDEDPGLRDMFDTVVDDLLHRYGLQVDTCLPIRKTIFDS